MFLWLVSLNIMVARIGRRSSNESNPYVAKCSRSGGVFTGLHSQMLGFKEGCSERDSHYKSRCCERTGSLALCNVFPELS